MLEISKLNATKYLMDISSFTEKKEIHDRYYSLGDINGSGSVNDKLILISLICHVYLTLKAKKPETTYISILRKITGYEVDASEFNTFLEGLAILCEDMSYGCTTSDTCGLKTQGDIIAKIKSIINNRLPF